LGSAWHDRAAIRWGYYDSPEARTNKMFFATNPPAGSGAPGACGDATTPCPWDGSKELNSGALSGGTGTDYYYKINLGSAPAAPITVNYFCAVHGPTMKGSFTVT